MSFFPRDEYFMRLALREAERALEHGDAPIGCVVVHSGEVLAAAPNERELRYRPRSLDATLSETVDWYLELLAGGRLDGGRPSPLSLAAVGVRLASRAGLVQGLRAAEPYVGRRLVAGG